MVRNQTVMAYNTLQGMDKRFSAHKWLLKHLELFVMQNLVTPMRSQWVELRKDDNGVVGRGYGKKQKSACNRLNKGVNAST